MLVQVSFFFVIAKLAVLPYFVGFLKNVDYSYVTHRVPFHPSIPRMIPPPVQAPCDSKPRPMDTAPVADAFEQTSAQKGKSWTPLAQNIAENRA